MTDGRYLVREVLGEGGMGRVHRAHDRVLGVDVALKHVVPQLVDHPRVRARFELEVRMAARIHHANVVPILDVGVLDDAPYFTMPLATGGSLNGFEEGWDALRARLDEVLDALGVIHARGILHRDLKPWNVLLHDGRALVADLGLADVLDHLARGTADRAGTPEFMPPEQRDGRVREFGPPLDVYAVGAMITRLVRGPVPRGLAEVLDVALHPEPTHRFPLAADLRAALADLGPPEVPLPPRYVAAVDGRTAASWSSLDPRLRTSLAEIPDPEALFEVGSTAASSLPAAARRAPRPLPRHPPPPVERAGSLRPSLALFALRDPPLAGREAERAVLWEAARDAAATGRPRVVVVVGESGAGKSMLVGAVARQLEELGHAETVTVQHAADDRPEDGVTGAIQRLLRSWPGEGPGAFEARVWRLLAVDFGDTARSRAAAAAAWARGRADPAFPRALLLEWLGLKARRGLATLVVEDAQWAAEHEGLALAQAVLDHGAAPVVAFVTVGAESLGANPALRRDLDALVAAGARRVDLARLPVADAAALLRESIALDPELADAVARHCEGNAQLARQIVQAWARDGALVDRGDLRFALRPGATVWSELPADAAAAFVARVARHVAGAPHPDATRRTLHRLALAGARMPRAVFDALGGDSDLEVAGLLRRDDDGLRWDHGLLHEAVRRAAEQDPEAPLHHRALAHAWSAYAAATGAAVHGPLGLALHGAGDHLAAVEPLGKACFAALDAGRAADLDRLSATLLDAADRAYPDHDPEGARAMARLWRSAVSVRIGDGAAAAAFVDEAEALNPPDRVASRILSQRGHLLTFAGRAAEAVRCLERAVALARSSGDDRALALALNNLGMANRKAQRPAEGEACLREAVLVSTRTGEPVRTAAARRLLADALREQGRLEEAEVQARQSLADARAAGAPHVEAASLHALAVLNTRRGDLLGAERLLRAGLAILLRTGARVGIPHLQASLGDVARRRGDLVAAHDAWRDYHQWATARSLQEEATVAAVNLALVAWAARDAAALARRLDESERNVGAASHWSGVPVAMLRVAQALLADQDAGPELDRLEQKLVYDPESARLATEIAVEAEARGRHDVAARCRAAALRAATPPGT